MPHLNFKNFIIVTHCGTMLFKIGFVFFDRPEGVEYNTLAFYCRGVDLSTELK